MRVVKKSSAMGKTVLLTICHIGGTFVHVCQKKTNKNENASPNESCQNFRHYLYVLVMVEFILLLSSCDFKFFFFVCFGFDLILCPFWRNCFLLTPHVCNPPPPTPRHTEKFSFVFMTATSPISGQITASKQFVRMTQDKLSQ